MSQTVRKAVIPAAGLGTRFLPATKAIPKEMLPVVDKPAIQYVIEEAVSAGIDDILIVSSPYKKAVEDHFDRSYELEHRLSEKGKDDEVAALRAVSELAQVHVVRQGEPLGLGHAVSMGARHVGREPFAVLLPDDLMIDDGELLRGMIGTLERTGTSVVALKEVSMNEISSYGCAEISGLQGNVATIRRLVEKPRSEDAPSNLAVMGRYVFTPSVFDELANAKPGVGGEIQVTDAMDALARTEGFSGYVFSEGRYDIGQKQDFLRATVELALAHPELGSDFRLFLADLTKRWSDDG
ncbi:MAG: UTP--glucose-phosphate uridylyltransferase [Acidimicrobiia bacterium]|jgi:UTP--glucose-1-phosphate uridylyltransferase|nr:UTP--glucose-phosphate uridylyltransferase [Acidimicrobiia bacterium]